MSADNSVEAPVIPRRLDAPRLLVRGGECSNSTAHHGGSTVRHEVTVSRRGPLILGRQGCIVAYLIGGIMAIGAVFGGLNAMYSAVSTRTVEIATLRDAVVRAACS